MRTQRLGCLTPLGIISSLLTLLVIAGALWFTGGAVFSPGGLSTSRGQVIGGVETHAELSTQCEACHTAPWEQATMTDRCLGCHQGIKTEIQNPDTLHGALIVDPVKANCRECHTEHHGPLGVLTRLDMENFPHDATGFSLKGHSLQTGDPAITCTDCHAEKTNRFLSNTCTDCHARIDANFQASHTKTFGGECLSCHDGLDSFGKSFTHANTSFPLFGKHDVLECQSCHAGMSTMKTVKETPQDCFACHQKDDAHKGQYGTQCASCHSPEGWLPASFDHSKSSFPLKGAHSSVECSACHSNQVYKGTSQECFACHRQDDKHSGQMGTDCALCHTVEGWDHIIFDHSQSKFPLTGGHTGLPCVKCHAEGKFTGMSTECNACHAEPKYHLSLFDANCSVCHTLAAWRPAKYDRPHSFPISHGDAGTCQDCHPSTLAAWTCFSCHDQTEIASKHREEGISDFSNCISCHANGTEGEDGGGDGKHGDGD
jgi:hypothetical protein